MIDKLFWSFVSGFVFAAGFKCYSEYVHPIVKEMTNEETIETIKRKF